MKSLLIDLFTYLFTCLILLSFSGVALAQNDTAVLKKISESDVVFQSPSKDEADSIPLGNGTTGINLWIEENGDLLFYISRNDAISEMHRLLKLGRVRVSLSPNPFTSKRKFIQRLDLSNGICEVATKDGNDIFKLRVWVDSDSQMIYVTGEGNKPREVTASLENWRTDTNILEAGEIGSTWLYRGGIPNNLTPNSEAADNIENKNNSLRWYHRNAHSPVPIHIKQMRLEKDAQKIHDPIKSRTFGGVILGEGFVSAGQLQLKKKSSTQFKLHIATESIQAKTIDTYQQSIATTLKKAVSAEDSRKRTSAWWNHFWTRSWVFVKESSKLTLPKNKLPIHFGAGRNGSLPIKGEFRNVSVRDGELSKKEIEQLASKTRQSTSSLSKHLVQFIPKNGANLKKKELGDGYLIGESSADLKFSHGLILDATIRPKQDGRIFDKIQPGGTSGFLFDILHGQLRLIVGDKTLMGTQKIPMNEWSRVTGLYKKNGDMEIYLNGNRVDSLAGKPKPKVAETAPISQITQAYILTKFQFACQQRSVFPSHFNGGIFTMAPEFAYYATDPRGKNWSADYRFYGPNFWWQNTRFMYQLHLAQGNDDLLDSFFEFYFRNIPAFQSMAKRHFNAEGIFMYETISHFGLPGMGDFGWNSKEYTEPYTKNIWQQALELGAFALDRYDFTQDKEFLKKAIYWCDQSLIFYDTRFKKDAKGKIVIFPTHGVETYWHDVTDDMPSIAGLNEITQRLLALPHSTTTEAQRKRWERIAKAIPELPKKKDENGDIVPDVALKYNPKRSNYEAPEMYAVYPFRLYGLNRKTHDIEEARRGWHRIHVKGHYCWYQTGIFAARLGMAEQAADDVMIRTGKATRLKVKHTANRYFRFPGFYSSSHDWCPDYDGAGNMANTLQEMLLHQGEGDAILLLPAWPKTWDTQFKLYAPKNTSVEVIYKGGKLLKLKVTPESRRKDVILPTFLK